jgi:hypothetical protein
MLHISNADVAKVSGQVADRLKKYFATPEQLKAFTGIPLYRSVTYLGSDLQSLRCDDLVRLHAAGVNLNEIFEILSGSGNSNSFSRSEMTKGLTGPEF